MTPCVVVVGFLLIFKENNRVQNESSHFFAVEAKSYQVFRAVRFPQGAFRTRSGGA